MKRDDLKKELSQLNKNDLRVILWLTRLKWLRHKISLLTPVKMLIPITLLQVIVFITAVLNQHIFLHIIAIGNFIVVGIAMIPLALYRPEPLPANSDKPHADQA